VASRYPPNTRARDIDRANTSALLDAAFGDGQINKAEHRAMSELASEARTLADLDVLVGDLQRPADAPPDARPPRDTARPWFPLAVAAVAVAAAVGAFTLADGDDAEATVTPVAQQIDFDAVEPLVVATPNPVSPEGMKVFLDRYRAKFGDLIVDDLTLYEGGHASRHPDHPEGRHPRVRPDDAEPGQDRRNGRGRPGEPERPRRKSQSHLVPDRQRRPHRVGLREQRVQRERIHGTHPVR